MATYKATKDGKLWKTIGGLEIFGIKLGDTVEGGAPSMVNGINYVSVTKVNSAAVVGFCKSEILKVVPTPPPPVDPPPPPPPPPAGADVIMYEPDGRIRYFEEVFK